MNGSYQLLKFLSRVCCRLSDRSAVKMGHILGEFFWMLIPNRRKKLALQNIFRGNITKDAKTAEEISKAAAVRFGTIGMSVFRFPLLNKKNISDYVVIQGKEKLDEILASGEGCIIAGNHCGNWELEGAALALYGYPILAVGMKQSNEGFDKFIREYRSIPGQMVEYKTGVRDMLRRLKEGYFVGLLCDQDPGDTGLISPFLGQKTLTPTGPAHFALMTGRPVLMAFMHQLTDYTYEIIVEDPIYADKNLGKKESVRQITDDINKRLGNWIKKHPEDWFWLHNRWKWTDRFYPELKEES